MKTAMKELIEELRQTRDEGEAEYRTAYNLAIAIANQHLEKEKEQIIDAYKSDRNPCSEQDAEDYYFSTFKIEKITIIEHNQNK